MEILTGEGGNTDFITKEVAGTLSLFQCREEPFQGAFFHPKPEAGELVPTEGKGMLVETNQAKAAFHVVTALPGQRVRR